MTFSTYLLYLAAVALLVLSPGPTMLTCITTALNHGPRQAVASAVGSVTAVLGVMLLSALGLGALLVASVLAFTVAKFIGAAYLVWLGIKTFKSTGTPLTSQTSSPTPLDERSFFRRGLMVGASNPKALLFFAAFFPQFMNPAQDFAPQFSLLAGTFIVFELTVLTLCALSVSRLAPVLCQSGPVRWINRVSGGLFILMGSLLLLSRRHT